MKPTSDYTAGRLAFLSGLERCPFRVQKRRKEWRRGYDGAFAEQRAKRASRPVAALNEPNLITRLKDWATTEL